jgi:hypothetical protein
MIKPIMEYFKELFSHNYYIFVAKILKIHYNNNYCNNILSITHTYASMQIISMAHYNFENIYYHGKMSKQFNGSTM